MINSDPDDAIHEIARMTREGYNRQMIPRGEAGKQRSMYTARFHDVMNRQEEKLLSNAIKNTTRAREREKNDLPVNIVDYGVGPGRSLYIYEKFQGSAVPLHIIGFDIAIEALHELEKKLVTHGFSKIDNIPDLGPTTEISAEQPYQIGATYQKGNIRFTLAYGNVVFPPSLNQCLFEKIFKGMPVNVMFCGFGPLSNIPGRANRIAALTLFRNMTDGTVLISVPNDTKKVRDSYPIVYDYKSATPETRDAFALEGDGDIIYERSDSLSGESVHARMFYHLYTPTRMQEDLAAAGYKTWEMLPTKSQPESILTKKEARELRVIDAVRARAGKFSLEDTNFIMVVSHPHQHGKGFTSRFANLGRESEAREL